MPVPPFPALAASRRRAAVKARGVFLFCKGDAVASMPSESLHVLGPLPRGPLALTSRARGDTTSMMLMSRLGCLRRAIVSPFLRKEQRRSKIDSPACEQSGVSHV